jgi:glycolate oxidase
MEKLIAIVGQENFTNQLEELVPYSYDALMNVHRPDAVWPESTEQVAEIVKFANDQRTPVVPRGAGTSLSGGVIPIQGGIIIDLSRMNRILEMSIENRYVRVREAEDYTRKLGSKTW